MSPCRRMHWVRVEILVALDIPPEKQGRLQRDVTSDAECTSGAPRTRLTRSIRLDHAQVGRQAVEREDVVLVEQRYRHVVRDGGELGGPGGEPRQLVPRGGLAEQHASAAQQGHPALEEGAFRGRVSLRLELPGDAPALVDARRRAAGAGRDQRLVIRYEQRL